jgi:hypothetical protein
MERYEAILYQIPSTAGKPTGCRSFGAISWFIPLIWVIQGMLINYILSNKLKFTSGKFHA